MLRKTILILMLLFILPNTTVQADEIKESLRTEEEREMYEESMEVVQNTKFDFSNGYKSVAKSFIGSALIIATITKSKDGLDIIIDG